MCDSSQKYLNSRGNIIYQMVKKITKIRIIDLYTNSYGRRYYLREMAELLKKPHQTIKPYVEGLVKEKILIKNKRKKIIEYSLNFNNKQLYDYLTIAEKEKLAERMKEDLILKVLFEKLSAFFSKDIFVIFGSSVYKIKKDSDIDLLIIGKSNLSKEIKDFEDIYNRKIHKIQVIDIKKISSALIKEVYKKHILLNETERIIRFFGELYEENKLV